MKTEQIKCIVCKKEYPRRLKKRRGGKTKASERGKNTITCSPKCVRIYRQVYNHIKKRQEREK